MSINNTSINKAELKDHFKRKMFSYHKLNFYYQYPVLRCFNLIRRYKTREAMRQIENRCSSPKLRRSYRLVEFFYDNKFMFTLMEDLLMPDLKYTVGMFDRFMFEICQMYNC